MPGCFCAAVINAADCQSKPGIIGACLTHVLLLFCDYRVLSCCTRSFPLDVCGSGRAPQ